MLKLTETQEATRIAEQALLGAILVESSYAGSKAILSVRGLVNPEDFLGYLPTAKPWGQCRHARIYRAMQSLLSSKDAPHQINTAQEMNRLHILQPGDCGYLCELVSLCPCSLDYRSYAKVVANYAEGRGIKRVSGYHGLSLRG